MVTFIVEYEIPPLRAIYQCEVDADDEESAREYFGIQMVGCRIRKITRKNGK